MSHLSAIGFRMGPAEFEALLVQTAPQGEMVAAISGTYIRVGASSGVQLWVQADTEGRVVGCNPHFAGVGRMRMGVSRLVRNPDRPLDGAIFGWAEPEPGDPEQGLYRFAVDSPELGSVERRLSAPAEVTLQIAAFAEELHCFPTEEAYQEAQGAESRARAEMLIPAGFREVGEQTTDDRQEARVVASGHVLQAELRSNFITAEPFWHIVARVPGGTIDIVADPKEIVGKPCVHGVVSGWLWLSALVVGGLRPERRVSLFQRRRG